MFGMGIAETVEGYVFRDTRCLYPFLDRSVNP